jgi:hypothetical protein
VHAHAVRDGGTEVQSSRRPRARPPPRRAPRARGRGSARRKRGAELERLGHGGDGERRRARFERRRGDREGTVAVPVRLDDGPELGLVAAEHESAEDGRALWRSRSEVEPMTGAGVIRPILGAHAVYYCPPSCRPTRTVLDTCPSLCSGCSSPGGGHRIRDASPSPRRG